MTTAELKTATGTVKTVKPMDPIFDTLDNKRARFVRMVDSVTVEIADNNGKVLPDWRHITQVAAM